MLGRFVVSPILVGREEEVRVLEDSAVEATRAGRTLFISGDAGVGKSRLAAEARRIAEGGGFLVLQGQCSKGASAPYAPFVAALRRHTRGLDEAALAALFDGRASFAASLLPEAAAVVSAPAAVVVPEDLEAAVWHVVERITATQPCLLLLEDLHWASPDMLRLLGSLVREASSLRLWIVTTFRTDELRPRDSLSALLAQLARARLYDEVALRPLDASQVGRMVAAIFDGADVGDEFTDAILTRSGGNPFFIEELCKVLVERGDVGGAGSKWSRRALEEIELPATVRETVMTRLLQLDATTLQTLRIAAIAGRRVDVELVMRAAGIDRNALGSVLVDGIDSQLLVERRDVGVREYTFRHALTREVLSASLIGPERQHAHRLLATALAELRTHDLDEVAGRVADHLVEAGESEQAIPHLLAAARRAAAAGAQGECMSRYQQALDLTPRESSARIDILLEAAECGSRGAGPWPGGHAPRYLGVAARLAAEALELARVRSDVVAQCRAQAVVQVERWCSGDVEGALAVLTDALANVEGHSDVLELATLVSLAERHAFSGDSSGAETVLQRALSVATSLGDSHQLARLRSLEEYLRGWTAQSEEAYLEMLRQAELAQNKDEQLFALLQLATALLHRGHTERVRSIHTRALEVARAASPQWVQIVMCSTAGVEAVVGNFKAALEIVEQNPPEPTDIVLRMVVLTIRAGIHLWQGETRRARAEADECRELARIAPGLTMFSALAYRARAVLTDGLEAARPLFEEALRSAAENPQGAAAHWQFTPDWGRALLAAGLEQELARWVSTVRSLTRDEDHRLNMASLRFCEGLLLTHRGDHDAARRALEEAVERYRSVPIPYREAHAWLALAELERRAGDVSASTQAARAAHEIAARIESPPLVEESVAALRRAGVRVARPVAVSLLGRVESLSSREMEVARLVAEGHSNAEIGRRLFLSEHTVRNHISNILGKLEVRSRVDVARWAAERGLVSPVR